MSARRELSRNAVAAEVTRWIVSAFHPRPPHHLAGYGRGMILSLLVSLAAVSGSTADAATLRIAGSDLFNDACRAALIAHTRTAGVDVVLDLKGSLPGRDALVAGRADAALLAHAPELDGADNSAADLTGYRRITVAWVAGVLAVAQDNPLTQITYEQLAGVFGADGSQAMRRWGDLGLGDSWASRPIAPMAIERRTGLTLEFFVHAVLLERPLEPGLSTFASVPEVLDRLVLDPSAIALVPALPATVRGVRPLLVTAVAGEVAFGPSAENIETGDYPLRLPLEVVFRAGQEKTVAPLVRFLASPEGAVAVEQSLLVPLPAGARSRLMAEFGRL